MNPQDKRRTLVEWLSVVVALAAVAGFVLASLWRGWYPVHCHGGTPLWTERFLCGTGLVCVAYAAHRLHVRGPIAAVLGLAAVAVLGTLAFAIVSNPHGFLHGRETSESTQNVGARFRGAVAYFEAEHLDAAGHVLPRQFPASVGLTPDRPFCGDGLGWCFKASGRDWDHPSWVALSFALGDDHDYKYELVSRGTGTSAEFTARAHGDLDCDGVYSTFERSASVTAAGEVRGGSGMYIDNELE